MEYLKAGKLLEENQYRVDSENSEPLTKTAEKVPYTAEDHAVLKDWIRNSTESLTGNKLYINLAEKVGVHLNYMSHLIIKTAHSTLLAILERLLFKEIPSWTGC